MLVITLRLRHRCNAWLDYGALEAISKRRDLDRFIALLSDLTAEVSLINDAGAEQPFIEDQPETPAPQFAIRALKSALLGTPNIKQSLGARHYEYDVADTVDADQHKSAKSLRTSTIDHLPSSPTKGILVTPGTGANKRKTVSFGSLKPEDEQYAINLVKDKNLTSEAAIKRLRSSEIQASAGDMKKETSLTKSLFEAQLEDSKQRIGRKSIQQRSEDDNKTSLDRQEGSDLNSQARPLSRIPDTTVDLNMPCSTSGKHWKGEYEQYQRQSNRELKQIIQHGQTIKSYAQMKDSEVISLNEKLNKQIAKTVAMEARVSELAIELANARVHGALDQDSPAETISKLAKQTALAIRYKQKADRYKAALEKRARGTPSPEQADDCVHLSLEGGPTVALDAQNRQMGLMRNDLEKLRSAFQAAEEDSAKLQRENFTLKQKMARVKGEMKSYETRRLAREERIKMRENKLIVEKESCEAKLADLAIAHEKLKRRYSEGRHVSSSDPSPTLQTTAVTATSKAHCKNALSAATSIELANKSGGRRSSQNAHERGTMSACLGIGKGEIGTHWKSSNPLFQDSTSNSAPTLLSRHTTEESPRPNIPGAGKSSIGTGTRGIKGSLKGDNLAVAGIFTDSGFSSFRREAQDVLQEIDQNAVLNPTVSGQGFSRLDGTRDVTGPPNRKSTFKSASCRIASRRSSIVSRRPSMLSFTPKPTELYAQGGGPDSSSVLGEKPPRILSGHDWTSTMGSRTGHLPLDRVKAARKRLDARKAEKRSPLEGVKR